MNLPGSGRGTGGFGSTGRAMSQHEDRDKDKIMGAFGGKKGLIDSGIPSIIFLVNI